MLNQPCAGWLYSWDHFHDVYLNKRNKECVRKLLKRWSCRLYISIIIHLPFFHHPRSSWLYGIAEDWALLNPLGLLWEFFRRLLSSRSQSCVTSATKATAPASSAFLAKADDSGEATGPARSRRLQAWWAYHLLVAGRVSAFRRHALSCCW